MLWTNKSNPGKSCCLKKWNIHNNTNVKTNETGHIHSSLLNLRPVDWEHCSNCDICNGKHYYNTYPSIIIHQPSHEHWSPSSKSSLTNFWRGSFTGWLLTLLEHPGPDYFPYSSKQVIAFTCCRLPRLILTDMTYHLGNSKKTWVFFHLRVGRNSSFKGERHKGFCYTLPPAEQLLKISAGYFTRRAHGVSTPYPALHTNTCSKPH